MKQLKRTLTLLLVVAIAASSIVIVQPVYAQLNQSVPEFTLRYVDKSYDVAPTTTSSIDPYTGNVTITTIPGRHISDPTIEVTISNDIGASYYGLRYKGHYSNSWTYWPYNGPDDHYISDGFFPPAFQASDSSYTVGSLYLGWLPQPIPEGAPIDVQVQALFGNFSVTPYGHGIDVGGPTYDAAFMGTAGEWSNTQTVTYGEVPTPSPTAPAPTPSPTVPEFPALVLLPLVVGISLTAAMFLRRVKTKSPI